MKIAVIGATGRTGRPLVAALLRRGHAITALVGDLAKLGDLAEQVQVVPGDSRTRTDLDRLVAGADAVASALGPTAEEASLHTDTATVLVEAMHAVVGVRRFVGVSGAGIDVPGDQKSFSAKVISKAIQPLGGRSSRTSPPSTRCTPPATSPGPSSDHPDWLPVTPPDDSSTTPTARQRRPRSPAPTSRPSWPTWSSRASTFARRRSSPPRADRRRGRQRPEAGDHHRELRTSVETRHRTRVVCRYLSG